MSNIERRLAEGLATNLTDDQIKFAETNPTDPMPGLGLKVAALRRHLSTEVPDELYASQQIAIRALNQSILGDYYSEAIHVQMISDVNARFDQIEAGLGMVAVPEELEPVRPPRLFNDLKDMLPVYEEFHPKLPRSPRELSNYRNINDPQS